MKVSIMFNAQIKEIEVIESGKTLYSHQLTEFRMKMAIY